MTTNAMIMHQYIWLPNNLYFYPMKLKYGLGEDLLWYSKSIGIGINV